MANYYIDPDLGNNGNSGAVGNPWATLTYALGNTSPVAPGDNVYLRGKNFNESVIPRKSGSSGGGYITVLAYPDETPVLRGESGKEYIIQLSGVSYLKFSTGLKFSYAHPSPNTSRKFPWIEINWSTAQPTEYIVLENFLMERTPYADIDVLATSAWNEFGIHMDGRNVHIEGLTIRGTSKGITIGPMARDVGVYNNNIGPTKQSPITLQWSNYQIRRITLEDNLLHDSAIEDGIQFLKEAGASDEEEAVDWGNQGTIVRRNKIWNCRENAIDLKAAAYVLLEGNIMWKIIGSNQGNQSSKGWNRDAPCSINRGNGTIAKRVIVRDNIIVDGPGGILVSEQMKVYNNTIIYGNRDYTGAQVGGTNGKFTGLRQRSEITTRVGVKNNIVGGHRDAALYMDLTKNQTHDYAANLYAGEKFLDHNGGGADRLFATLAAWKAEIAGEPWLGKEDYSISVNGIAAIQFADVPVPWNGTGDPSTWDYSLLPNSPAKETGTHLTTAVGGGSGGTVTVGDAGWFADPGWGKTGTHIEQFYFKGAVRTVVSVDYDGNTITFTPTTSWSDGDPLYGGVVATPDRGARPVSQSGEPPPPPPPPPDPPTSGSGSRARIQFAANTSGTPQTVAIPDGVFVNDPIAAWIECTLATANGTPIDGGALGVGAAYNNGGTWVHRGGSIRSQHNIGTTAANRRTSDLYSIYITDPANGNTVAEGSITATTATSVTIAWNKFPTTSILVTLELYDAASAWVGEFGLRQNVDAVSTVTPGFQTQFGRTFTAHKAIPGNSTNATAAYGLFCYNGSTIKQRSYSRRFDNGDPAAAVSAYASDAYVSTDIGTAGGVLRATQVTAVSATQVTFATKVGGYSDDLSEGFCLLLAFEDLAVDIGHASLPTATTDDHPVTVGHESGSFGLIFCSLAAINSGANDATAGVFGLGGWDGTRQYCVYTAEEDGSDPTDNESGTNNALIRQPQHTGATGVDVTFSQVDGNSVELDVTNPNAQACLILWHSIEAPAIPVITPEFSATPLSVEVGETVTFSDESTVENTTLSVWEWSFGDGETSSLQDPTHEYAEAGLYTVSLTVGDGTFQETVTKSEYIEVTLTPTPLPPPAVESYRVQVVAGPAAYRNGVVKAVAEVVN